MDPTMHTDTQMANIATISPHPSIHPSVVVINFKLSRAIDTTAKDAPMIPPRIAALINVISLRVHGRLQIADS